MNLILLETSKNTMSKSSYMKSATVDDAAGIVPVDIQGTHTLSD